MIVVATMSGFTLVPVGYDYAQSYFQDPVPELSYSMPAATTNVSSGYVSPFDAVDQAISSNTRATYGLLENMRREQQYAPPSSGSGNQIYSNSSNSFRSSSALSDSYKFLNRQRASINSYNSGIYARRSVSCAVTNSLVC
jgi:hypothetical protein